MEVMIGSFIILAFAIVSLAIALATHKHKK